MKQVVWLARACIQVSWGNLMTLDCGWSTNAVYGMWQIKIGNTYRI